MAEELWEAVPQIGEQHGLKDEKLNQGSIGTNIVS